MVRLAHTEEKTVKISWIPGSIILSYLKGKSPESGTHVLEDLRDWIQGAGTANMADTGPPGSA